MAWKVNPLEGKTINRRAGCGKTASPVRREGGPKTIGSPYPYPRQRQKTPSRLRGELLASRPCQNPSTPAHGSPKIKTKILRVLRVFAVKKTSNHSPYAPTPPNFHQIFFQIFAKLLSEQCHLCVNNPKMWKGNVARRQWFRPPLLASRHLPQSTAARTR